MKKLIVFLSVLCLILTSCGNSGSSDSSSNHSSSSSDKPKSPEELRQELLRQEQFKPTEYLSASGTYRQNFWGDKLKINCEITNKATMATYKDAVIRITYYSKTNSIIGQDDQTVYEIFPANSTKTVQLKINNYKDVSEIGWDVISASATE